MTEPTALPPVDDADRPGGDPATDHVATTPHGIPTPDVEGVRGSDTLPAPRQNDRGVPGALPEPDPPTGRIPAFPRSRVVNQGFVHAPFGRQGIGVVRLGRHLLLPARWAGPGDPPPLYAEVRVVADADAATFEVPVPVLGPNIPEEEFDEG